MALIRRREVKGPTSLLDAGEQGVATRLAIHAAASHLTSVI